LAETRFTHQLALNEISVFAPSSAGSGDSTIQEEGIGIVLTTAMRLANSREIVRKDGCVGGSMIVDLISSGEKTTSQLLQLVTCKGL
jgi:hypothetical protein